jgi:hypothetical protein
MLVTPLKEKYGYDRAAKIAKTAHKNGTTCARKPMRRTAQGRHPGRRLRRHRDTGFPRHCEKMNNP